MSIFVSKTVLVAIGLRPFLKPRLAKILVLTAKRGKSAFLLNSVTRWVRKTKNDNKKRFKTHPS